MCHSLVHLGAFGEASFALSGITLGSKEEEAVDLNNNFDMNWLRGDNMLLDRIVALSGITLGVKEEEDVDSSNKLEMNWSSADDIFTIN